MKNLNVEYRRIEELRPRVRNPRTHTKKQVRKIAASIQEFGFTNPVLIDANGGIIAGHGRVEAAKLLGVNRLPTVRLDHLTDTEIRAYVIADNRLAERAGWDPEILAKELQFLTEIEVDFDLTVTGFETAEIDLLIEGLDAPPDDPAANRVPESDPNLPPVSSPGTLWCLGKHRVLCADATEPESFEALMDGDRAQMVFVDPPYNVAIDGHVCGLGRIRHRDFAMASGEMSEAEFIDFLKTSFDHLVTHSVDGSIHFVCMDWRHLYEVLTAGRTAYTELKNVCVWNKTNGGMGSLYRSKHELILIYKHGHAPHINNIQLGRYGRGRTNVWDYPGVNSLRAGRLDELRMHPTVKPVALIADAIMDCSKRRGIVLDCFAGSGTTIIAAEKTGRRAYGMEIDPAYVDVAVSRWQDYTGKDAVHAESGLTFAETEKDRAQQDEEASDA